MSSEAIVAIRSEFIRRWARQLPRPSGDELHHWLVSRLVSRPRIAGRVVPNPLLNNSDRDTWSVLIEALPLTHQQALARTAKIRSLCVQIVSGQVQDLASNFKQDLELTFLKQPS